MFGQIFNLLLKGKMLGKKLAVVYWCLMLGYYHHTGWDVILDLSVTLGRLPQILMQLVRQERFGQLSKEQLEAAGQNMNLVILVTFLERFPFPLQMLRSTLDCRIAAGW